MSSSSPMKVREDFGDPNRNWRLSLYIKPHAVEARPPVMAVGIRTRPAPGRSPPRRTYLLKGRPASPWVRLPAVNHES